MTQAFQLIKGDENTQVIADKGYVLHILTEGLRRKATSLSFLLKQKNTA